ncbi:PAS domain-containing sensor histidine kinase [Thermocoleostomius sinensis]|uniref:histidine kinase n=1 Tax=Thermocoleostomius sinensis A174 TaxID=2016057 RepID=A0A9E8ZEH8_9CYAN|nr:PAS domain-containing sensor histidine kinase [Thermocoleostomius sinensis]WAL61884.1 PAS domain-containing sensor histidine kinase [Thermocoleostomius sinensis A174]
MAILAFLLGLSIGLIGFWWYRSRSEARLKKVLLNFQNTLPAPSLTSSSQLTIAIAQQQKVQQQLHQQIKTYETVLENAPIGYLQVDDENRLIWCNHQAKILLGIQQEPCPAKPRLLLELVRSYELDDLIEKTRDAAKPRDSSWTFHPVSSDPSQLSEQQPRALQGYGIPLSNKQVGIFLENRQEAANLLQRYDRWASDLAHELKTPLTSIRLVAETLQVRLDSPLKEWVDRLINETVRLSTLVQDLLDLSRLQRDNLQDFDLKPVDLVLLIESVWSSLEPLARKKELHLDYRGPESLLLPLNEARIHRLLVNLLDNAIKYSPPHQPIQVEVSLQSLAEEGHLDHLNQADAPPPINHATDSNPEPPTCLCLDVIDFGPGFADKDLPYVFDRFYRADPSRARRRTEPDLSGTSSDGMAQSIGTQRFSTHRTTTEKAWSTDQNDGYSAADLPHQGGSGLGLAIVRQIVVSHGGRVTARNHPQTGGAWIQVRLPWTSTTALTK